MRLTDYTDYALRLLMHLGGHPGQILTVREIAAAHGISHNHLTKIVHQLGVLGILSTLRGRAGGIQLARPADQIMLGAVIRMTEPDFRMVECFSDTDSTCVLAGRCKLKGILADATAAFLQQLDLVPLSALLGSPPATPQAAIHNLTRYPGARHELPVP